MFNFETENNQDKPTSDFLKHLLDLLDGDGHRISMPLFLRHLQMTLRDEFNADIVISENNSIRILFKHGERFVLKVEKER